MADKSKYEGPTGVVAIAEHSYSSTYTCTDIEKQIVEVVSVTQCKDGVKVYNRNLFDFSTMEDEEILEMASKTAMIAARGPEYRSRSSKEALKLDGDTLVAKDYFKRERKSKSFEDKVQELVDRGMPREFAELSIKDPMAFYEAMQKAQSK